MRLDGKLMSERSDRPIVIYCMLGATIAVILRIALFDWKILTVFSYPNHDMSQGAAFFVTNLHSLRLSHEIAWWKSNEINGYAQYFQSFLGPLAPTPSHLSFYVAALAMAVLDFINIRLSEYVFYVITSYVLLPWCAIASFGWLTARFVKHPIAIVLSCTTYALSTIGLWDGAWFYFQEPATFLFLLGSAIAYLQEQTKARSLAFLSAILIQASSMNYWTVYNIFFFCIFLGGYIAFFPSQLRSAVLGLWKLPRLLTAGTLCVAAVWMTLLASMAVEQSGYYVRPTAQGDHYDVQRVTSLLVAFPPSATLEGLVNRNDVEVFANKNPTHYAKYVGVVSILLAVLALATAADRKTLFLLFAMLATTTIIFAPAPLLWLWAHTPYMNTIQHLFRFYGHYVAQTIILLSAVGLGFVLDKGPLWSAVGCVLAAISVVDLGFYFKRASNLDQSYTQTTIWPDNKMTPEARNKLLTGLPRQLDSSRFEGGIADNLPLNVAVFPVNNFMVRREVFELTQAKELHRRSESQR